MKTAKMNPAKMSEAQLLSKASKDDCFCMLYLWHDLNIRNVIKARHDNNDDDELLFYVMDKFWGVVYELRSKIHRRFDLPRGAVNGLYALAWMMYCEELGKELYYKHASTLFATAA